MPFIGCPNAVLLSRDCSNCPKRRCSENLAYCTGSPDAYNRGMYIRPITVNKNGKRHGYWALVESYRTPRGPRQRVVSYLGQAEASVRCGMRQQASGQPYQRMLFEDTEPSWVEVDTQGIRVERCLEFGGPWLGLAFVKGGVKVQRPAGQNCDTSGLCTPPDTGCQFVFLLTFSMPHRSRFSRRPGGRPRPGHRVSRTAAWTDAGDSSARLPR